MGEFIGHSGGGITRDGLIYAFSGKNKLGYDDTTNVYNIVGGGTVGTLINGASVGDDFDLDGTSEYIDVNPDISIGASARPLTIDVWFQPGGSARTNTRCILARASGAIILNYTRTSTQFSNNTIILNVMNSLVENSGSATTWAKTLDYNTGDWLNVIFHIPTSPDIEVWVNGVSEGVQSFDAYRSDTVNELRIIGSLQAEFQGFNHQGKIGDIKIYNRLLTPNEIKQNYEATKYRFI